MLKGLLGLLFPPKCVLCGKLLPKEQTDLCHTCRAAMPEISVRNFTIPFVAGWTAVWYYKGDVRKSLLRYKFYNRRSYAKAYGRLLAMQLQQAGFPTPEVLTWVPVDFWRGLRRGYDQVELIARVVAAELGLPKAKALARTGHRPPQSRYHDAAVRRANSLGAYRVCRREAVAGKRVLLLDDIVTTGSTVSECARELLTAGASEVYCAAVAAAVHKKVK